MGLEAGKNKNKADRGLTTLNGLSDSNTFVKADCQSDGQTLFKETSTENTKEIPTRLKNHREEKHCLGQGWVSVRACARGRGEIALASLAVRSCGRVYYGRDDAFSGEVGILFPGSVCAWSQIPVSRWCTRLIPFGVTVVYYLAIKNNMVIT